MEASLLEAILCSVCGQADWILRDAERVDVPYADGAKEEVKTGKLCCVCGEQYPISDYVLSLAGLFSPALQQEAAYWDRYYGWLIEQGSLGFHDLELGQAPYITMGVPEPFPASDTLARYDVHHRVADHPLMREGHTLLDLGVGLGWTSLYFARSGYAVTAIEPSLGPIQAAKRHAIEQGVFIEYICAAVGSISFRQGTFDNVCAFHSLHHVPELEKELREIRRWMRLGGTLALDEHVGNSPLAAGLGGRVHAWAEAEVLPRYRSLSPEALATLPQEPHSALEDSSVGEIVPLVNRMFHVHYAERRHVFLDHYPLLHYLHTGRDFEAYRHALPIANQMQELVRQADPDDGDYITILAENTGEDMAVAFAGSIEEPGKAVPVGAQDPAGPGLHAEEQPADLDRLQTQVAELREALAAQSAWAMGLQNELARKENEIRRHKAVLRRLERGKIMRLLRLFGKR